MDLSQLLGFYFSGPGVTRGNDYEKKNNIQEILG